MTAAVRGVMVRDGLYLSDNRPARPQWRERDEPIRSVFVWHTSQPGYAREPRTSDVERLASFIAGRPDAGSYHGAAAPGLVIPLIDPTLAAFGDRTGSNDWAIHLGLAMNAEDWPNLSAESRTAMIDAAVALAVFYGRWMADRGLEPPEATYLATKSATEASFASGHTGHGVRDPRRRTDPGDFPWDEVLAGYADEMGALLDLDRPLVDTGPEARLQRRLLAAGFDPGPIDDRWGPRTDAALQAMERAAERSGVYLAALHEITSTAEEAAEADRFD